MTQIESARKNIITPEMHFVAEREDLDPEVIRWFKRTGKGYQSRIAAVLRSYVDAKRKHRA